MTLRQILDVIWKHRLMVVAVTLIAVLTAGTYLLVREVEYETTATVRLNAVVTDAAATEEIGGIAVELGESTVTSPVILDAATAALGEPEGALAGAVEASLTEADGRTGRMVITVRGASAESAQARAEAVVAAYGAYVDQQVNATRQTLTDRRQAAVDEASALQQDVAADPRNLVAQTNLTTALGRMSTITENLVIIGDAGATTAVLAAVEPGAPTVPGTIVVLAIALLTGLIVGVAIVLIRDQFDDRLRGDDEIESLVGVPAIGELGWDRSVKRAVLPLPTAGNQRTGLSEALRTLRASLQVLLPRTGAVVVFTSVEPGDGKSFVSANLAVAFARAGKRVILVGGDLRRPDLARSFGAAADGAGLTELLQDTRASIGVDDVMRRVTDTDYDRLRLLPSGATPPDPADLLAQPRLAEVIALLRTQADIVIIDSPPSLGMADAAELAAHADGTVVLSSVRRTDRGRLQEAVAGLEANGVTVLGVVANHSRKRMPKSYSAYYLRNSARRDDASEDVVGAEVFDEPAAAPAATPRGRRASDRAAASDDRAADETEHPDPDDAEVPAPAYRG